MRRLEKRIEAYLSGLRSSPLGLGSVARKSDRCSHDPQFRPMWHASRRCVVLTSG